VIGNEICEIHNEEDVIFSQTVKRTSTLIMVLMTGSTIPTPGCYIFTPASYISDTKNTPTNESLEHDFNEYLKPGKAKKTPGFMSNSQA
jgi:hypothetical protein